MAFLPVAIGAAGTVSNMVASASAASAQRSAAAEQQRAAMQQFQLQQQRFEYSKSEAAQMYMREALVAEEMSRQAQTQFQMARAQQNLQNIYEETQAASQDTEMANTVQRLLGAASSTRGAASLQNMQQFEQLKMALGNDEQALDNFVQRIAAMGLDSRSNEAVQNNSLLGAIDLYQRTLESANTTSRVADVQAQAQTDQANFTEQYRQLTKDFLDSNRNISRGFQAKMNEIMPSILSLQHQRNMVGLDAASKLRQAELAISQQSGLMANRAQMSALDAQISSMPSVGGSLLGGALGVASQVVPFILSRNNPQSIFPSQGNMGQQQTNQYPVYEFGQRLPQRPAQVIEFGQPLPPDNSIRDINTSRMFA